MQPHLTGRRIFASAAVILSSCLPVDESAAQGCVPAKGAGVSVSQLSAHGMSEGGEEAGSLHATAAYRWLRSDRHFVGDHEEKQRQREGSEVVNDSHFLDVSLTYAFNPRYSATLTVPLVKHDRSSTVRANDEQRTILERYHTQSSGLGDARLMGSMWLLDPAKPSRGNTLLGVGIEVPTGKKDVADTFRRLNSASGQIVDERRNVDQSIQPGDGGWALLLDVYSYWKFTDRLSGFVNAAYNITPEETNGVLTSRGNPFEAEMSIMDTYLGRAGVEYQLVPHQGVTVSLDTRIEGVPVHDLVGGSDGFRRPGYSLSIEPGVVLARNDWAATLYVPVTVYRNRQRSVPDRQFSAETGTFRHGDAAFADLLVMLGFNKNF